MPTDGGDRIARQDEMMELLYWLEGERLGGATLDGMSRFLDSPRETISLTLQRLAERGDVVAPEEASGEYRLTETGRREAARRFAEEFAPLLSQGHGECNDPDCDCHTNPAGTAECRRHAH